jgi:hypothetical protein
VKAATKAIHAHQDNPIRYRNLNLQLRYSIHKPSEFRKPNPTLHVAGFAGDQVTLLSYLDEYADKVEKLVMSAR